MNANPKPGMSKGEFARLLRQIHLYLGVVFAPVILMYALTGTLQVLHLHEADRDSGYKPAAIVEKLGQVHIHQRFALRPQRGGPPPAATPAAAPAVKAEPAKTEAKPGAFKPAGGLSRAFFALSGVGLTVTTLLGLWVALMIPRQRKLVYGLLAVGTILPVILIAI